MKFAILLAIAVFSFSLSSLAQEPESGYDHDPDGPVVYTNPNECLDALMAVKGKSYKILSKDVIVNLAKDGTLDIFRSNYKSSEVLPNGQCPPVPDKSSGGYNTVLGTAYAKAKRQCDQAVKKAGGPGHPVRSSSCDAMVACDNQNKSHPADWYDEATKLLPNLKQGPPPRNAP